MREAFVVLIVVAVLLVLTAIKYRRQIVTLIGFYKQVQAVRSELRNKTGSPGANRPLEGIQLVKCECCGKWVSETRSVRYGDRVVCADNCPASVRV